MATRSGAYSSATDSDSIEELSAKLTADLRKNIRALGPYPVLSEKWAEMARSLARIANISEMERSLPKKDDATLWECEELALRYVLEDGKLNLCLRLLEEHLASKAEVAAGAKTLSDDESDLMEKFELGLGQLLANAWLHVEALQTTDLPLMVRLIAEALQLAINDKTGTKPYGNTLPATVLKFMYAIAKNLEELGESRVFPSILSQRAIPLTIEHLSQNHSRVPPETILLAAQALSGLAQAEDFGTHKDRILDTEETRGALASLDDAFVTDLADDFATRRTIRPLMDLIAGIKRSAAK